MIVCKALAWAALILGIAFVTKLYGLSDPAQFAVLAGLAGAAVAALQRRPRACGAL